jgi:conserved oligomeric Golgi complex subunit 6
MVDAQSLPKVDVSQPPDRPVRGSNPGWNPISLRLYKVLGANYDDAGTKEALDTLSAFYTTPTPPAPVSKEINGNEDAGSEADEDGSEVTDRQKMIYTPRDTAVRARKNLRRDTEAKLTEGSQKFLKAFGEVDEVCHIAN